MTRCSTRSGIAGRGSRGRRASSAVGGRGGDGARTAAQREPGAGQRLVQRAVREVGGHDRLGAGRDEDRRLDGDRLVVGAAQAAQVDDRLARRRCPSASAASPVDGRMTRASIRDVGTRPRRSISWVNVISRLARRCAGGSRDEAAAARLPVDEALLGQALHRVPGGHPADPELGDSSASDGSRSPGPSVGDALAQRLLDPPVLRAGRRRRSCGACCLPWQPKQAAERRRPPRHGPPRRWRPPRSRARRSRSRHRSSDVVRTRRVTSARIGSSSSRPAAAIPPPMTTRSGRDDGDHVADPDAEVAADAGQAGEGPRVAGSGGRRRQLRPSRCRTPRRSGRPGRRPRGSRGSRNCTTGRPGR